MHGAYTLTAGAAPVANPEAVAIPVNVSNANTLTFLDEDIAVLPITIPDLNFGLAGLADGGYAVIKDGESNLTGQRYDRHGDPLGGEFAILPDAGGAFEQISVADLEHGGFVVVWDSFGPYDPSSLGINAQMFDADGQVAGDAFRVNTVTQSNQMHPRVTALGGGGFAAMWARNDRPTN